VIIVVVQVGAVKIYVGAVRKKETSFTPLLNANVFYCKLFFESHPILDQTQGSGAVFS
jgi:hypothetical protein